MSNEIVKIDEAIALTKTKIPNLTAYKNSVGDERILITHSIGEVSGLNKAKEIILAEQKECTYSSYDEDRGAWECSECNNLLVLNDGNPKDNEFEYCPYCGKKISKIVETEDTDGL